MSNEKNFYDLDELREEVFQNKISKAHIYNLCSRGDIPAVRIGRRLLVPSRYVRQLLNGPEEGEEEAFKTMAARMRSV
ncbi:helix-turn-helix domain-containing protein [Anaeroarcus burkinensis]|uniref:helix-turn-helix domain-containing protein n=1 Tax=Anaeroarcus burkinensis TaxID=82376 RepID=UPI000488409B|nr:helix-turn-helix domain-containing protein [Anaeroarcus burkinensis]